MDKIVGDIAPVEEKRSHSRAGCDCQLSVCDLAKFHSLFTLLKIWRNIFSSILVHFISFQSTLIDLGPGSFPRHVRNVTCDEHRRCFHSRAKGLHCLPIHYQVKTEIRLSIDFH